MEKVINLLARRNREKRLFNIADIRSLTNYICKYYNIPLEGVKESPNRQILLSYYIDTNQILLNPDKIKNSSDVILNNYQLLYLLLRELRHCIQYHYSLESDNMDAKIYLYCFDWITSGNRIKSEIYRLYYDYFPSEMNANITATLFILYFAKLLGDSRIVNIFLNNFENRLDIMSSNNTSVLLKKLFGELELKNILESLDEYEKFLNGLLEDSYERNNIKQMLLLS